MNRYTGSTATAELHHQLVVVEGLPIAEAARRTGTSAKNVIVGLQHLRGLDRELPASTPKLGRWSPQTYISE